MRKFPRGKTSWNSNISRDIEAEFVLTEGTHSISLHCEYVLALKSPLTKIMCTCFIWKLLDAEKESSTYFFEPFFSKSCLPAVCWIFVITRRHVIIDDTSAWKWPLERIVSLYYVLTLIPFKTISALESH